jgi:hypothetical protein
MKKKYFLPVTLALWNFWERLLSYFWWKIALCNISYINIYIYIYIYAYDHPGKCTLKGHEIIQPVVLWNHNLQFKTVCTSGLHWTIKNSSSQLAQDEMMPTAQAGNQKFKIKLVFWINQRGVASAVQEHSLQMHVQTLYDIQKGTNKGLHTYVHGHIRIHKPKYTGTHTRSI